MTSIDREFRFGYRITGSCNGERRLVDATAAFTGYANCDDRAEIEKEGYLSAFQFSQPFADHITNTGSVKGYGGPCWAPWLWVDIDREGDQERAMADTRALCVRLTDYYELCEDDLLVFFSGSKGFHIGIPTARWTPPPSEDFHRISRRCCEAIAASVNVAIDKNVYDRVRAFRAPNSRHPRTGLHKRRFSADEFSRSPIGTIIEMAKNPAPFDYSPIGSADFSFALAGEWEAAMVAERQHAEATNQVRTGNNDVRRLNRKTLEFIREGASDGERSVRLFSAAANLAEFECSQALADALLTESALDSGMTPLEVRRQIECGLKGSRA